MSQLQRCHCLCPTGQGTRGLWRQSNPCFVSRQHAVLSVWQLVLAILWKASRMMVARYQSILQLLYASCITIVCTMYMSSVKCCTCDVTITPDTMHPVLSGCVQSDSKVLANMSCGFEGVIGAQGPNMLVLLSGSWQVWRIQDQGIPAILSSTIGALRIRPEPECAKKSR